MKISCLVIDDEPLARNRLLNLIKSTPELHYLGECKTGKEAINMIQTVKPDLIFLDIKMKDMTGFDVLKRVNVEKKPAVIFVTAFDKFALKAFDFSAFDYLLKPFKKERFNAAVNKVLKYHSQNNSIEFNKNLTELINYFNRPETHAIQEKLPIKTGRTVSFIDVDDIKYIVASGSYIDIYTAKKVYVMRSSLREVLVDINNVSFKRIHRSTVINLNYIDTLIHSNYGEIDVRMKDSKRFRVSGSYKKEFLNILGL